jgi:hypothetical protein
LITAPYAPDGAGAFAPAMPDRCICSEPGVACWIVLDHWLLTLVDRLVHRSESNSDGVDDRGRGCRRRR